MSVLLLRSRLTLAIKSSLRFQLFLEMIRSEIGFGLNGLTAWFSGCSDGQSIGSALYNSILSTLHLELTLSIGEEFSS